MDGLSQILVLFNSVGPSAERLRKILASSPTLTVEVREIKRLLSGRIGSPGVLSPEPTVIMFVASEAADWPTYELIKSIKRLAPNAPLMMAIDNCQPAMMFDLLDAGVADFVSAPWREIDLLPRIWQIIKRTSSAPTLVDDLREKMGLNQLIGASEGFVAEVRKIPVVARCDANVLISGETGTGKELFARAVHYLSSRARAPFVPINCGGTPTELLENELFGHERGAFTGADRSERGLVQEADGGTLFLDEIDCLPLQGQVKLLRFLQDKEYRPLGSRRTCKVNVRVVSATNSLLHSAVREGRFRADLYFRLNVIPLRIPPLRARREDIPLLVKTFVTKYAGEFNKEIASVSPQVLQALMIHDWPGNVRELEHVVERAVALSENSIITDIDFGHTTESMPTQDSFREAKAKIICNFEVAYIQNLLLEHHGNITQAAQVARKNRRAFWELIRKHGIDVNRFKLNPAA